jgi:hypothetical protein
MAQQYRVLMVSVIIAAVVGFLAGLLGGRLAAPRLAQAPTPGPAPAAAVVQAQGLQLMDSNGRRRGSLGVDSQGAARLELFGPEGVGPVISLAADSQGSAALEFNDPQGKKTVALTATPGGLRQVALYQEGQPRLGLEMPENGEAAVNLYDKGSQLITLGLTSQNEPRLIFYGQGHKTALEWFCGKKGNRHLTISGLDGTPRVVLGLKDNKKAALGLFDRRGKTRAALMDEPSLILLKGGKLVAKLP